MPAKRILLAMVDTLFIAEFHQAVEGQWEVASAATQAQALDLFAANSFDVVVADASAPEIAAADLVHTLRQQAPKTVRFCLALESERDRFVSLDSGAHQFLAKPCYAGDLKRAIERALALENWVTNNNLRELISRIRTFPTIPSIYFEILAQLNNPNSSTEDIGATIAKDMAVMTKLLQILNSAYFGLSRKISDPAEAVGILGMDTVKSMVMAIKAMGAYDKVKPVYFSIDKLWRHSTNVARFAHQLTMMETDNSDLADAAYTAGLMHDVGKIVLASNFESQYRGVQSLAQNNRRTIWEVEKEFFGAGHAEIGAYLLGLWGIPWNLVEAAALHHCPCKSQDTEFTPLTAVHVADAMTYEVEAEEKPPVLPVVDLDYLSRLGLGCRLDEWRMQLTLATAKRGNRPTAKALQAREKAEPIAAQIQKAPSQDQLEWHEPWIVMLWANLVARWRHLWQGK